MNTHFIDPRSPWQHAYNESLSSIIRTICLDRWLFGSLTEVRVVVAQWLEEYNMVRPNESLGGIKPDQFLQRWTEAKVVQQPESLSA